MYTIEVSFHLNTLASIPEDHIHSTKYNNKDTKITLQLVSVRIDSHKSVGASLCCVFLCRQMNLITKLISPCSGDLASLMPLVGSGNH